MEAEVVGAALHARGGKGYVEGLAQRRDVLEVDLLLEVLRAGRHEHALSAENRGNQVGERLAGAGAGLRQKHPARFELPCDGDGHVDLPGAALEVGHRTSQGTVGREDGVDLL